MKVNWMTVYVSLPRGPDLNTEAIWTETHQHLTRIFPTAEIISSCSEDSNIEDADLVIFRYEQKDNPCCRDELQRCRDLNKCYNFITRIFTPDRSPGTDLLQ